MKRLSRPNAAVLIAGIPSTPPPPCSVNLSQALGVDENTTVRDILASAREARNDAADATEREQQATERYGVVDFVSLSGLCVDFDPLTARAAHLEQQVEALQADLRRYQMAEEVCGHCCPVGFAFPS